MTENAYIHIPFCKSKCKYCSFVSYQGLDRKEAYLSALKNEIKSAYRGEYLKTLYFGGGTPSLLSVDEFKDITGFFRIKEDAEVTVELNPESVTFDYLNGLRKCNINRVSFGCQSFDDDILKYIGRKHTSQDIKNALNSAFEAGFENVSIDFIYGLPNQTVKGFEKDLMAFDDRINHVSLYGLKIDKGCFFYENTPENIADEDMQADMYLKSMEILKQRGFVQYETSNFSRDNCYSRHNINYWNNNSYYGFGVAAHGYENGTRYFNVSNLDEYINGASKIIHKLSEQEKLEEEIFLGLRKVKGIDICLINKKYGIDFYKKYGHIVDKYGKYFVFTENSISFNTAGMLVSNVILSEFLE